MNAISFRDMRCDKRPLRPVGTATGPMTHLANKKLLVVADVENLSLSAEDKGLVLVYSALAHKLSTVCKNPRLAAFATIEDRHRVFAEQMEESGWELHARPVEYVPDRTRNGRWAPTRNSDAVMLMTTGHLLSEIQPDVLVIGSGDGGLIIEMARTARRILPSIHGVSTLSFEKNTSSAARSKSCDYVDENIFLGNDVLGNAG